MKNIINELKLLHIQLKNYTFNTDLSIIGDKFINLINMIRQENINTANIIELPKMKKCHLIFSMNYDNFYKNLFIFLDNLSLNKNNNNNLLNLIITISYLFEENIKNIKNLYIYS